ncbi:MAG: tyrosine-type recombinase/integrase [Bacillota bacterium]
MSNWTIVIDLGRDPATGKRKRLVRGFKGAKREAEQELARLLVEYEQGTQVQPSRMTVAEYLRRWLQDYCSVNLRPRTYQGYRMYVERHLIPNLGQIELGKLLPMHLQSFYSKALREGRLDGKGGLSPRSVQLIHRILHEALDHAVKWQLVPRNVADAVEAPRPRRPEMKALDPAGVRALLKAAEGHPDEVLIHLAIFTGLRRGELLALRWEDVDLERRVLHVRQALTKLQGKIVFQEPKSHKSRRTVALAPGTVALLRAHKRRQAENRLRLGAEYHDRGLVFCRENGEPLDPSTITHRFAALAKRAGFPGLRFHDLRHTHATLLLAQGVHPKVVQERLGHEDISTTLNTYSHVLPGLQEQAAARLEDLLRS